jgi:hydroxyacylglutathione hydrolase
MSAEQVAEGVWLFTARPEYRINQYLIGGVLVDSGTPVAARRLLREIEGRAIVAHAVTHAHPDHYGSSKALSRRLDLPFWCPSGDADALESRRLAHSESLLGRLMSLPPGPAGPPIARRLREGDEVAGFRVLDTPGHSPGHISYWRETDGVLIVGDVAFNVAPLRGQVGLREPPAFMSVDPARNRESIRRLAALQPTLALFGHGPPLRDPRAWPTFVAGLPTE